MDLKKPVTIETLRALRLAGYSHEAIAAESGITRQAVHQKLRGLLPLPRGCSVCGKSFQPKSSASDYCSEACRKVGHAKLQKEAYWRAQETLRGPPVKKKCAECGAVFETHRATKIYCTRKCMQRCAGRRNGAKYRQRKRAARKTVEVPVPNIIGVRLSNDHVRAIGVLVSEGIYNSRSDAIRTAIDRWLLRR